MQFKIGQTVSRLDPGNHEVMFSVQNERDMQYHTDLQARGYLYTDITKASGAGDFDLPPVPGAVRIHRKPFEECESCSA